MNNLVKGAMRVCDTLDCVERAPASSREIFKALALPRSSGYDLLGCLLERQYLHKRAGGTLVLGDEIHALAMSRHGLGEIASEISSVLMGLQEQTQEIAQLVVLKGLQTLVTHSFGSLRSMRISTNVGTEAPASWSAAGRLLSAHLADRTLRALRARDAEANGEEADLDSFVSEVRSAWSRGYAIALDRSYRDVSSIAAPVVDRRRRCVATIALSLPVARMSHCQDSLITLVCAAAAKLSCGFKNGVE